MISIITNPENQNHLVTFKTKYRLCSHPIPTSSEDSERENSIYLWLESLLA